MVVKNRKTRNPYRICCVFISLLFVGAVFTLKPQGYQEKNISSSCTLLRQRQRNKGGHFQYFLIGAQKSGTSTLSRFIRSHNISRKTRGFPKEFHLFDSLIFGSYKKTGSESEKESLSLEEIENAEHKFMHKFNSSFSEDHMRKNLEAYLIGDATPNYIISEKIAQAVSSSHPHARIVISLRNPVRRAISHLRMVARRTNSTDAERLTFFFDTALDVEMKSIEECGWIPQKGYLDRKKHESFTDFLMCVREKSCTGLVAKFGHGDSFHKLAKKVCKDWIIARGSYLDQLNGWLQYFPPSSIEIFDFESVICAMPTVLERLENFLCLPKFNEETYEEAQELVCDVAVSEREKVDDYAKPSENALKRLQEFYRAHNDKFKLYVEHHFPGRIRVDWNSEE